MLLNPILKSDLGRLCWSSLRLFELNSFAAQENRKSTRPAQFKHHSSRDPPQRFGRTNQPADDAHFRCPTGWEHLHVAGLVSDGPPVCQVPNASGTFLADVSGYRIVYKKSQDLYGYDIAGGSNFVVCTEDRGDARLQLLDIAWRLARRVDFHYTSTR